MTKLLTAVLYVFAVLLLPGLMEGTEGSEKRFSGKIQKIWHSSTRSLSQSLRPTSCVYLGNWRCSCCTSFEPKRNSSKYRRNPSKFSSQDIIHISFSGHSAFLLRSGELLTAGRNDSAGGGGRGSPPIDDSGQLGRDGDINSALPVTLPDNAKVTATSCGRYHTVALTSTGEVLTFGLNDRGQLGRSGILGSTTRSCGCDSGGNCNCSNDSTSNSKPGSACIGGSTCRSGIATKVLFDGKILGFDDKCKAKAECQLNTRAVAVAAGRYSSAAVFEDGTLVVWGLIACGTASNF